MDSGGLTPEVVLRAGEWLVSASTLAGLSVFLYFAFAAADAWRPRTARLIADDPQSFAIGSVPYAVDFVVCWNVSLLLERLIVLWRPFVVVASRHYAATKIALNLAAVVTKHHLFGARSTFGRAMLFVSHLVLAAASEAMCGEKYERAAVDAALMLLFWLTVLILVSRVTVQNAGFVGAPELEEDWLGPLFV